MGIPLGLLAACCWGTADFLIKRVTARVDVLVATFAVQVVGILVLLPAAALTTVPRPDPAAAWQLLGIGVLGTLSYLLLYRAFAAGTLAIVSPVTSAYSALTVVLAVVFLHEQPGGRQVLGIVAVLAGIVLAAFQPGSTLDKGDNGDNGGLRLVAGLPAALGASATLGVLFFWLGLVVPKTGALVPALAVRLVGACLVGGILLAVAPRRHPRAPRGAWPLLLPIGVLDAGGFLAYNVGVSGAYVSIVSPLGACFSVVTVALAMLFLHERPAPIQYAGIALVIGGVLALALR